MAMGAQSSRRGRRRMMSEINVVPYIDVTLVLLIIFMVTAPMIVTGSIDLPRVGQSSQQNVAAVEVIIRKDGSHAVRKREQGAEEKQVTRSELVAAVQAMQADASAPVIILAERDVRYDNVVQALNLLQSQGIARVGLAVRQE